MTDETTATMPIVPEAEEAPVEQAAPPPTVESVSVGGHRAEPEPESTVDADEFATGLGINGPAFLAYHRMVGGPRRRTIAAWKAEFEKHMSRPVR